MTSFLCNACNSETYSIYSLPRTPVFQNKLFPTEQAAQSAASASVELVGCKSCGLVFNALFDNSLMDYDKNYQNAQDHSPSFQSHLDDIASLILSGTKPTDQLVKVGCGKGYFLEMLKARGLRITGFDPSYEGDNPDIVKTYYNAQTHADQHADAVIMRHCLEHIEAPYQFLLGFKKILQPQCKIFIEVPRLEWIVEHHAFWDVFHEHCNYFSEPFFRGIFSGKCTITSVFSDQYMLVEACIGDLQEPLVPASFPSYEDSFQEEMANATGIMQACENHYVWGAGAKGIAFANALDSDKQKIRALIDINPNKQNLYISLTGHACVAPADIDWHAVTARDCLWIMNGRYKEEILSSLPVLPCRIMVLGA